MCKMPLTLLKKESDAICMALFLYGKQFVLHLKVSSAELERGLS